MREDTASSVVAQPADLAAVLLALRPGLSLPCGGRTPVWHAMSSPRPSRSRAPGWDRAGVWPA